MIGACRHGHRAGTCGECGVVQHRSLTPEAARERYHELSNASRLAAKHGLGEIASALARESEKYL